MLQEVIKTTQAETEQAIKHYLGKLDSKLAKTLYQAMEYSVVNGGKRVRPFLTFAVADLIGISRESVTPAAIALELIHCYSLIHDDLPAMDDDELRRGKPTCHIKFDEAQAILAGDALQAFAFELLANAKLDADIKIEWVKILSRTSGYNGMCGGQSLDLIAENAAVNLTELETIHLHKTGALLVAAVQLACAACPTLSDTHKNALITFAENIGLAFQVRDDVLDITSTTEQLGKPQGSDQRLEKSTYPSLLGLEQAQEKANNLYESALVALQSLPYNTDTLEAFSAYLINRNT